MCIAPHGSIVIPELRYKTSAKKTWEGFNSIKSEIDSLDIEHLVVIDPHDQINKMKFTYFDSENYNGYLKNGSLSISKEYKSDPIINLLFRKISSNTQLFISNREEHSLSWGSFVPLYLLHSNQTLSLLSIDRNIPELAIKSFGCKIYDMLNRVKQKICIVFSCDLSHCHSKSNPKFPYNEYSKIYDDHVNKILENSSVQEYNDIEKNIVSKARTDAHAQLTMLAGICEKIGYKSHVLSYEVPSYFGMLTGIIK